MSENPPADWYPDPEVPGQQRYWDGSQWTEHRAPGTPATPAASTPAGGGDWQASTPQQQQPWGAAGGAGAAQGTAPDTWLWQSIVATLLCCLPFGIAGIVFASQANSAVSAGNYALAREKAGKAKTWTLVSVGVGLFAIVAYVIFIAVVVASEGGNF